jgi:hypothetical protein
MFQVNILNNSHEKVSSFHVIERPATRVLLGLLDGGSSVFMDKEGDQFAFDGGQVGGVEVIEVKGE